MGVYVDTSVLAAYYCPEPGSDAAQSCLASSRDPTISWLTSVELVSALSRKVREGTIERQDAVRIEDMFRAHVAEGFYTVVPLESADYSTARERIGRFDNMLRTLDALHLAVAARCALELVTADRNLAGAAQAFGMKVTLVSKT